MKDEILEVEVEPGFKDVQLRAFRGGLSIEVNDHWCGSTETGFGATVSMNLTREQAQKLGEFLVRKADEDGHSDERKVPKMGAESPTNRTTTPYNGPEPTVAKADEKG